LRRQPAAAAAAAEREIGERKWKLGRAGRHLRPVSRVELAAEAQALGRTIRQQDRGEHATFGGWGVPSSRSSLLLRTSVLLALSARSEQATSPESVTLAYQGRARTGVVDDERGPYVAFLPELVVIGSAPSFEGSQENVSGRISIKRRGCHRGRRGVVSREGLRWGKGYTAACNHHRVRYERRPRKRAQPPRRGNDDVVSGR
jgi:hypothetical protein